MSIVEIPKGRYYGVKDAAEEIGITVGRIRQMIRWGQLSAIRISDRVWLISEREVQKHKKSRSE
jgi:excisionase family DNA binding protein